MLKYENDRLDYGKILAPPMGYTTKYAIGTTYSLDLDALVGACISLGLSESTDSSTKDTPIYLLEALNRTKDKVMVFCESGQMKVPRRKEESLHTFLEGMVLEVSMKNKKSFHPKFWLVKYVDINEKALFRCVILSRNLTFDRSWDVAVCIEGFVTENATGNPTEKKALDKSTPISEFISELAKISKKGMADKKKKKLLKEIVEEVKTVQFELSGNTFTSFRFLPIGLAEHDSEMLRMLTAPYDEMLIMTPFLSKSVIKQINEVAIPNETKNVLITRKSELYKLKQEDYYNFEVYVMKDLIVDGEGAISDSNQSQLDEISGKQDIHAKLYVRSKGNTTDVFLGSLNASDSALHGNVESMLQLSAKRKNLTITQLKLELFGEDEKTNPFERIDNISGMIEEHETVAEQLQQKIKEVCRLSCKAVIAQADENYRVNVAFEKLYISNGIQIAPLFAEGQRQALTDIITFESMYLEQLSEFYVLSVSEGDETVQRLIRVPTENMPEERDKQIVNRIIKDRKGFLKYLSFILGEEYLLAMMENAMLEHGDTANRDRVVEISAIYEKMLVAAAHSPDKLKEIKKMMELISQKGIVPEGFEKLFRVFEEAMK